MMKPKRRIIKMPESNRVGLERGRAKFAYDKANSAITNKEYKQWAKKVPMMIKTNGLGATLAFLKSKEKDKQGKLTEKGLLYQHISDWLKDDEKHLIKLEGKELVLEIVTLNHQNTEQ